MLILISYGNKSFPIFKIGDPTHIQLKPKETYCLRIYSQKSEIQRQREKWKEEEVSLVPLERDNLIILQFSRKPEGSNSEPKLPEGAQSLLLRAEFKVDNDGIVPKIIRWPFRIEKESAQPESALNVAELLERLHKENRHSDYQIFRIPLLVAPRKNKIFFLIFSIIGTIFIQELFEYMMMRFFPNTESLGDLFYQQGIILFLFAGFLYILFSLYGFFVRHSNLDD